MKALKEIENTMKNMEMLLTSKDKQISMLQRQLEEIKADGDSDSNLNILSKKDLIEKVTEMLQKNSQ